MGRRKRRRRRRWKRKRKILEENVEGEPGRVRDGLQLKPAIFMFSVTWAMGEVA